jgi:hypothetical protein
MTETPSNKFIAFVAIVSTPFALGAFLLAWTPAQQFSNTDPKYDGYVQPRSVSDLVEKTQASTVTVFCEPNKKDGVLGTAWAIDLPNGVEEEYPTTLITNHHVIEECIGLDGTLTVALLFKEEVKAILNAHINIKLKMMLSLIYSCGLRCGELLALQPVHIDSKRNIILLKCAKGKKDRIIPLSPLILKMLREYYKIYKPKIYLFEGSILGEPYSEKSLQSELKQTIKKVGIAKAGWANCALQLKKINKGKLTADIPPWVIRHTADFKNGKTEDLTSDPKNPRVIMTNTTPWASSVITESEKHTAIGFVTSKMKKQIESVLKKRQKTLVET